VHCTQTGSFNASGHYMVKGSRRIQAWLSRHGPSIQYKTVLRRNLALVKMLWNQRPPFSLRF
jgi:hypothetical protein